MADTVTDVSYGELEVSLGISAPYANRVLVTPVGPNARIAFLELMTMEDGSTRSFPRAAVVVPLSDLLALRDVINHITKDVIQVPVPANG